MAGTRPIDDIATERRRAAVGDAPDLLRAQLARMNEEQLRRLLLWLDQRGAAEGRSFAVHQDDPGDPASRELIELRLRKGDAPRRKPKLRLRFGMGTVRPGRSSPDVRP